MSILLAGGAGYIGTHTCVDLIQNEHKVVILDNFTNSSPAVIRRVTEITGVSPPVIEADVRDEATLCNALKLHNVDAVIHFAGLKAVGKSVEQPLDYYDCNLNSTLTILRAMKACGVNRLVFSSSATVYSANADMPLSENSPTGNCSNPYGWTKFMNEIILKTAAAADPTLSIALLRYFNPIGAHPSGLIGEMPSGVPNNLMPYILQVAGGVRPRLNVYGDDYPTPDGTCIRDYIHVVDLARGHAAACDYLTTHSGVHTFNLGSGNGVSVLEMVRAFIDSTGVDVPYVIARRRPGDNPVSYSDASLAETALGWRAQKSVADMCRDGWNWQRNNPEGYP